MTDPNPYDASQTPGPLKPAQFGKRGLGVIAILLLTPVAVGVAFAASCGVTVAYARWLENVELPYGPLILIGFAIFLSPPLLVLLAMLWWAVRASIGAKVRRS